MYIRIENRNSKISFSSIYNRSKDTPLQMLEFRLVVKINVHFTCVMHVFLV